MRFSAIDRATTAPAIRQAKGPVAIIIAEDDVEIDTTVRHHGFAGFRTIILVAPPEIALGPDVTEKVIRIDHPTRAPDATEVVVNAIAAALPEKTWLYYCYNAEYLFYPYTESR
ncbi:MAG: glycosyltransferase family 2 protein, partial [Hyphomicrobiales bacterium]|nr:glycosyltransferase family 2 protein [Hyphomicrobiales bacterium]